MTTQMQYLKEIRRRKDLLLYLVSSGLRAQHRNTFLGYLWWLLDPLLNLVIYYFVVGVVFRRSGPDTILYLVIALSVWRWLQTTVTTAARSIASQSGIISQVYLPKVIFPLSAVFTQLANFGFSLIVVAAFLIAFGQIPGPQVLWLPVIMAVQLIFMTAVGLPLSYASVFVRDMDNLIGHALRIWFYASPVIWTDLPGGWGWLVDLNPMTQFLHAYRDILMKNAAPDFTGLLAVAGPSVLVILYYVNFFSRHEHRIVKAL